MPKKKSGRKKTTKRRVTKSKLKGYTKVKAKGKPVRYALVFKKGSKLAVGKGRYKTKASLTKAARKYL